MEYSQIIDGNKLIAEFMGYKPTEKETGEPTYTHESMEKGAVIWAGQFGYNKSWNDLMPVVAKLNECDFYGKRFKSKHGDMGETLMNSIGDLLACVDIETAWEQVINLIKWSDGKI